VPGPRSPIVSQSEFQPGSSLPGTLVAGHLWMPEESEVKSSEHQDNANIHRQPFPESVSEEREIYTDYNGCHRHRVKHASYLSAHFSTLGRSGRNSKLPVHLA